MSLDDPKNPAAWFSFAQEDLAVAKVCLTSGHLSHTLVNCQQGVEKALKGFLISHGWPLAKTHEIGRLLAEAEQFGAQVTWFSDRGDSLSFRYFSCRYPDLGAIELPREEVEQILAATEKLLLQLIPSSP